jgi:large subunit ribosomal protein L13
MKIIGEKACNKKGLEVHLRLFIKKQYLIVNTLSYKTQSLRKEDVERDWFVVDAQGKTVGRLCTTIATMLRGKHKPNYTPHVDNGDYIIVLNADKVTFSGNKWKQKEYQRYSGYPGGQKSRTATEMLAKKPEAIIENAVKGMLPKSRLGRAMYKKLFVYVGNEHPHSAQQPKTLEL